jgi:ferredoxin-NADP reductase
MHFHAGQFAQIFVPTGDPNKPRRTSYSIASSPYNEKFFELCVTHVEGGVSSTFLHNLKVGDTVKSMGPLGKFTINEPIARDLVFIATGSGIAPFRSMINDLINKKIGKNIYLVFGNRFEEDIIYRKEWESLANANKNFHYLFNLSRPADSWKGKKGYVQDMLEEFVPNLKEKDFYICGLVKMIEAVTAKLTSLGVPATQVHFERYD